MYFCSKKSWLSRACDIQRGHVISKEGISPLPSKIEAIKEIPVPTTIKEVCSFLGLSGYYRRFIKNSATILAPLTKPTTKARTNQFNWTAECQHAFNTLQACLCNSPVLVHPNFHKEFMLQTDASDIGLGAILSQLDKGFDWPIAYMHWRSYLLECKYCTTKKEAFVIVFGIHTFRTYLLGCPFKVITDHTDQRATRAVGHGITRI